MQQTTLKALKRKQKPSSTKKARKDAKQKRKKEKGEIKLSIAGKAIKFPGTPTPVKKFGNSQVQGCLMITPPVPVPLEGIDEKNFKVDKDDGRNKPQLIKRFLDNLVENGTIEDYMDFYHKFVGCVKAPRSRALYFVWTVQGKGFDPKTDIWPIPSASLKYFSLTKDSLPSVLNLHRGKEILEAILSNDKRIRYEMENSESIMEDTMIRLCEKYPFFDLFSREGVDGMCSLPRIDARAVKDFSELSDSSFVEEKKKRKKSPTKEPETIRSKSQKNVVEDTRKHSRKEEEPKAVVTPRIPSVSRDTSSDEARSNAVIFHYPSILICSENAHGDLMKRVCKDTYMTPIPFKGSSNEEILQNVEHNWEDSFMMENEEDGNAVLEKGVSLVLNSRINVGSTPPFDLGDEAPESRCKDFIAGTNPAIKEDEIFEDDIEDEERITLVKTLLSAIAIPAASYDPLIGKNDDDSWYRAQAKDSISRSEVPIELILSSPETVSRFFERQLKGKDMIDVMASLYMQHKFVGMINEHISAK